MSLRNLAQLATFTLAFLLLATAGCQSARSATDPLPIGRGSYDGPPIELGFHERGRMVELTLTLTAPTGGYRFVLDHAEIRDDQDDQEGLRIASLFLSLEAPAPDEMVTQALVEHELNWSRHHDAFDEIRVYVNQRTRGAGEPRPTYRRADVIVH